jgi:hypothetical protein
MLRRLTVAAALFAAVASGCGKGGPQFAEVSGRVTTKDGKPVPGVSVLFQPIGSKDNMAPGPTSAGQTDADGRYRLIADLEQSGAVVGPHRVQIMPASNVEAIPYDEETGSEDGFIPKPDPTDLIVPTEFNADSKIQFDVPEDGTDQADFVIEVYRRARGR